MTASALKILYVNSFYHPYIGGGAERTLKRLTEGMTNRGHRVAVFTTGDTSRIDEINGVTVLRNKIDNIYWHFTRELPGKIRRVAWHWRDRSSSLMAQRFAEAIDQFAPDLIQFHNLSGITPAVWAVAAEKGVPSIQVLHDLHLLCPNSSMFKRGKACQSQCSSCAMFRLGFLGQSNKVDAVVGVSAYTLNTITRHGYFPGAVKQVINNAQTLGDPDLFVSKPLLRFGFIGSITPAKGLAWLIDQFPEGVGSLSVAGTGSPAYVKELMQRAAGKSVEFQGHVPTRKFFSSVDVAIVPSIWNEPLPGVAIEASAFGKAVIASNRGGIPEIVQHNVNGILCDPERPESLSAAVRLLHNDRTLLRRLCSAGPETVRRFLDIHRFLNEYDDLYRRILKLSW